MIKNGTQRIRKNVIKEKETETKCFLFLWENIWRSELLSDRWTDSLLVKHWLYLLVIITFHFTQYINLCETGYHIITSRYGPDLRSSALLRSVWWILTPLMMGPMGCPTTSVRNYHHKLRNNPKQPRSQILLCGSLKSRRYKRWRVP
jgi:hypothetical protein